MENDFSEWYKAIGSGVIMATLGWFSKQYNWFRQRPKDAIDVKKVEQEIKSDSVKTAIEVTNLMLTRLTQAEQRLTDIQDENDKLRVVIASLKGVISDTKSQMQDLVNDLANSLKVQDHDSALKEIRKKYGLDK